ncbi:kinase-like domain-containing protein [Powellomyces hirtus]|nr:kinase-like domain-containing protein [Powellomyces hirtus]
MSVRTTTLHSPNHPLQHSDNLQFSGGCQSHPQHPHHQTADSSSPANLPRAMASQDVKTQTTTTTSNAAQSAAKKNLIRQFFNSRASRPAVPSSLSNSMLAEHESKTSPPTPLPSTTPSTVTSPVTSPATSTNASAPAKVVHRSVTPPPPATIPPQPIVSVTEATPTSQPVLSPIDPAGDALKPVNQSTIPLPAPASKYLSPTRAHVVQKPPSSPVQRILNRYPLNQAFLEKYYITAELGSGGFGHVLAATRRSDGKEVAVKLILKKRIPVHAWARDPEMGVMPMEVYLIKRCEHPNVVGFEDFFECERFAYLIMEMHGTQWSVNAHPHTENHSGNVSGLPISASPEPSSGSSPPNPQNRVLSRVMEGEPLVVTNGASSVDKFAPSPAPRTRQISHPSGSPPTAVALSMPPLIRTQSFPTIIARKPSMDLFEHIEAHSHLPEEHARRIFTQIASAVSYLHSHGIVHRDLKDENIVIDAGLTVKLIDFGSAAFEAAHNKKASFDRFQGTLHYASPEILEGKRYRGKPSDIWALGVLLYTMLFGECPFRNSDEACSGPYKRPRVRVSKDCLDLVQQMLQKHPEDRPSAAEVLSHPWVTAWTADCGEDVCSD